MRNHFRTNEVLEITDDVNGKKVSARFGPNCTGIYAQIEEPLQIIPLMHALEYSHSTGFIPSGVEMRMLEEPSRKMDISGEKPAWRVCVVAYKRDGAESGDFLNSYNNFLKNRFISFPSNVIIKSANRQEIGELSGKADYRDGGLLFFSNPEGDVLNSYINKLKNYPIQYKMKPMVSE